MLGHISDEDLLKIPWDLQNKDGRTTLHEACLSRPWLVRQLKDHQIKDWQGNTAMHLACYYHPSIIPYLEDHQIPNSRGETPLHSLNFGYGRFSPLLKWHEIRNEYKHDPHYILKWDRDPHVHVLAKLRRLLGTLPTAFIRLVHGYT